MSFDTSLETTGIVIEVALIGLLVWRRAWRTLPIFFVYALWLLVSDVVAVVIVLRFPARYDIAFYLTDTVVDLVLQFCALVEIAWSVLRPIRSRLSARALLVIAAAILLAGAAIWPLTYLPGMAVPSMGWRVTVQLEQTTSILRVLLFVLLAGCSQLLSLDWRDRELQVATGFGIYSLVSVAMAVVNTHQATAQQFAHLYRIVSFGFLCSLAYWAVSFARPEAKRREFSPRMLSALLKLAETAHLNRVSLEDKSEEDDRQ